MPIRTRQEMLKDLRTHLQQSTTLNIYIEQLVKELSVDDANDIRKRTKVENLYLVIFFVHEQWFTHPVYASTKEDLHDQAHVYAKEKGWYRFDYTQILLEYNLPPRARKLTWWERITGSVTL